MDSRLKQDALIEDALQSQPLAPMPRNITLDVMARIQVEKRPAFVTWTDFVVSGVIAACVAARWFTWQHLPAIVIAKLRVQGILLYQSFLVNERWLTPGLFFGLAALLAALTIPALLQMTKTRQLR